MPIENKTQHTPTYEAAPKQPHLAVLTQEFGAPDAVAIPPGSIMMIVMDPKDPVKGLFPIALVKVTTKRLDFKCPCGNPNCSRRVVFHATWSGRHPPGTSEINIK